MLSSVEDCLLDTNFEVRQQAVRFVWQMCEAHCANYSRALTQQLVTWLDSGSDSERQCALGVMVGLGFPTSPIVEEALRCMSSPAERVQLVGIICLHQYIK